MGVKNRFRNFANEYLTRELAAKELALALSKATPRFNAPKADVGNCCAMEVKTPDIVLLAIAASSPVRKTPLAMTSTALAAMHGYQLDPTKAIKPRFNPCDNQVAFSLKDPL